MYILIGVGPIGVHVVDPLKKRIGEYVGVFHVLVTEDERSFTPDLNLVDIAEVTTFKRIAQMHVAPPAAIDADSASVLEYWRREGKEIVRSILTGIEAATRSIRSHGIESLDFLMVVDVQSPLSLVVPNIMKDIQDVRADFPSISPTSPSNFTVCLVHASSSASPYAYPLLERIAEIQQNAEWRTDAYMIDTGSPMESGDEDDTVAMLQEWIRLVVSGHIKKEPSYDGIGSFGLVRRSLPIEPFIRYLANTWAVACFNNLLGSSDEDKEEGRLYEEVEVPQSAISARQGTPCSAELISRSPLGAKLPTDIGPHDIQIPRPSWTRRNALSEIRDRMRYVSNVIVPTIETGIQKIAEAEKKSFVEQVREQSSKWVESHGIRGVIRRIEKTIDGIQGRIDQAEKQIRIAEQRKNEVVDYPRSAWLLDAFIVIFVSFIASFLFYLLVWKDVGIPLLFSMIAPVSFAVGLFFVVVSIALLRRNVEDRRGLLYSLNSHGLSMLILIAVIVALIVAAWQTVFTGMSIRAFMYLVVPFVVMSFVLIKFMGEFMYFMGPILNKIGLSITYPTTQISRSFEDAEKQVQQVIESFSWDTYLVRLMVATALSALVGFVLATPKDMPVFWVVLTLPLPVALSLESALVGLTVVLVYTFVLGLWAMQDITKHGRAWPDTGGKVIFQRIGLPILLVVLMFLSLNMWGPVVLLRWRADITTWLVWTLSVYLIIVGVSDIYKADKLLGEWAEWFEQRQCWYLYKVLWHNALSVYEFWLEGVEGIKERLQHIARVVETQKNSAQIDAEQAKQEAFQEPKYSVGYVHTEAAWELWAKKYVPPKREFVEIMRSWFEDVARGNIQVHELRERVRDLLVEKSVISNLSQDVTMYKYFREMMDIYGVSRGHLLDAEQWMEIWDVLPAPPFEKWSTLLKNGGRPRWSYVGEAPRRIYLGISPDLEQKGGAGFTDAVKRILPIGFTLYPEPDEALCVVQYQTSALKPEDILKGRTVTYPRLQAWKQAYEEARQSLQEREQ